MTSLASWSPEPEQVRTLCEQLWRRDGSALRAALAAARSGRPDEPEARRAGAVARLGARLRGLLKNPLVVRFVRCRGSSGILGDYFSRALER